MSESTKSTSSGIGFLGLLAILFIALKLTHYIDWSWWWVLAPMWIPSALVILFLVVVGAAFLIKEASNK